NARLVQHDRDAEFLELHGRPDAGQQQRLDRADRAGRQDHLAAAARDLRFAVLLEAHAGRAPAVELDALDQAAGFKPKVAAAERGLEKSARRRPAPSELLVDVIWRRAFIVAGVEIVDAPNAG